MLWMILTMSIWLMKCSGFLRWPWANTWWEITVNSILTDAIGKNTKKYMWCQFPKMAFSKIDNRIPVAHSLQRLLAGIRGSLEALISTEEEKDITAWNIFEKMFTCVFALFSSSSEILPVIATSSRTNT